MHLLRTLQTAFNRLFHARTLTGERVSPEVPDENFLNHLRVYQFAEQFVKGKIVLDVGCGTGYGAYHFVTHGAKSVFGIDFSDEAIHYAKKKFIHPDLQFAQMDAQDITYPNGSFDLVFSSENLEHLKEPEKNIAHIKRVLKKGGLLVLGTPNKEISSAGLDKSPNPFHLKEFYFEELEALVRKHFRSVYIFESKLESPSPVGRQMKEDRRKRKKVGLEPGNRRSFKLGRLTVDLTDLNNTHSFMVLAW